MLAGYPAVVYRKFLGLTLPPWPRFGAAFYTAVTLVVTVIAGVVIGLLPVELSGLLVGGAIFAVLALIKPILTVYLLIPIIPFSSLLAIPLGNFKVGGMELVLAFGLAAWFLKLTAQSAAGQTLRLRSGPLIWAFMLFLGGVSLSWLTALSIGASLVETIKWVEMALVYLFVINLLPRDQIKWVVLILMATGLAQAALGLYQFIFKVGPEGFLLFDGRFLRAYGTFNQPNPYGGYLGLLLPLALSLTLWAFSQLTSFSLTAQNLEARIAWLFNLALLTLPLGIMLAALFASQSRGAWLGFAAAGLVVLMLRSKTVTFSVAGITLVGVVLVLLSSFELRLAPIETAEEVITPYDVIVQRVADTIAVLSIDDIANTPVTDANFATLERLAHWQAAGDMWRDNLWLGVGFGNYAAVYPAYAVGRWLDPLGHAHNYLLNIGAEAGVVGISVYLIFWIFAFGLLWLTVRRSNGFEKAVVIGIIGIMVHLHVHNLVDNLYVQGMYLHIAIVLGIALVIFQSRLDNEERDTPR